MKQRCTGQSTTITPPERKRVTRACDQCNQLRTKCNGGAPCAHCCELGLTCNYLRTQKKRGKVRKIRNGQQSNTSHVSEVSSINIESDVGGQDPTTDTLHEQTWSFESPQRHMSQPNSCVESSNPNSQAQGGNSSSSLAEKSWWRTDVSTDYLATDQIGQHPFANLPAAMGPLPLESESPVVYQLVARSSVVGSPRPQRDHDTIEYNHQRYLQSFAGADSDQHPLPNEADETAASIFQDVIISNASRSEHWIHSHPSVGPDTIGSMTVGTPSCERDDICCFLASSTKQILQTSTAEDWDQPNSQKRRTQQFPALACVLPQLVAIIPASLAYSLLEHYFSISSTTFIRDEVLRLSEHYVNRYSRWNWNYEGTSQPALLVSMLLVAAQTSESKYLTTPSSARGKVSQKLFRLTIDLLGHLNQTPMGLATALGTPTLYPQAGVCLEDIAASFHLAIVVCAIGGVTPGWTWWNAAFVLISRLQETMELQWDSDATSLDPGPRP